MVVDRRRCTYVECGLVGPTPAAGRHELSRWGCGSPTLAILTPIPSPARFLSGDSVQEAVPGGRAGVEPIKNSARGFPPGRSSLAEVGQQISVRPIDRQLTCWRPSGPTSPSTPRRRGSAQRHTGHSPHPHHTPAPHRTPARSSRCRPSSRALRRSSWCRSSSCERAWPSAPRSCRGGSDDASGSRSTKPHHSWARSSQHWRRRPAQHSRCRLRRRARRNHCQHHKPARSNRCRHRSRVRCSCRSSCASACTSRTDPSDHQTDRASSEHRSTNQPHSSARSSQHRRRRPAQHSRCRLRRRAQRNHCQHHSRARSSQHRHRSRAHSTKHRPCSRASCQGARNRRTGYKR